MLNVQTWLIEVKKVTMAGLRRTGSNLATTFTSVSNPIASIFKATWQRLSRDTCMICVSIIYMLVYRKTDLRSGIGLEREVLDDVVHTRPFLRILVPTHFQKIPLLLGDIAVFCLTWSTSSKHYFAEEISN